MNLIEGLNEVVDFIGKGYRLTKAMEESGQRDVFVALDQVNRLCVIKFADCLPTKVARINKEVQILQTLNSNSFPKLYDSFYITSDDIEYYVDNLNPASEAAKIKAFQDLKIKDKYVTVEEYIENIPWAEFKEIAKLDFGVLLKFVRAMVSALGDIASLEKIHRDLKPDNILIRPDFSPVIIDFGIAKSVSAGTNTLTKVYESIPCTWQDAAPEQVLNQRGIQTHKIDQFSLGVVLYELLSIRRLN